MAHRTQPAPNAAGYPIPTRPPLAVLSIRRASVITGASLLLMAALAGFGYIVAVEGLVTYDNATRNATNILESSGLFRSGMVQASVTERRCRIRPRRFRGAARPTRPAGSMVVRSPMPRTSIYEHAPRNGGQTAESCTALRASYHVSPTGSPSRFQLHDTVGVMGM